MLSIRSHRAKSRLERITALVERGRPEIKLHIESDLTFFIFHILPKVSILFVNMDMDGDVTYCP